PPSHPAKIFSSHFDKPRQTPRLAGLFIFSCGLRTRLHARFSAVSVLSRPLFSVSCGLAKSKSARHSPFKINHLRESNFRIFVSAIAYHLINGDRKTCVKSAQQAGIHPQSGDSRATL
ncbi:hypothetical protein QN374_17285, partial [Herbaspirillum sp. RTI4]|uniref:hypothetical protein n=1 Tax=Herbaspirillum sp. RTI4 TaxID=3048640 RepID=UPI002B227F7F